MMRVSSNKFNRNTRMRRSTTTSPKYESHHSSDLIICCMALNLLFLTLCSCTYLHCCCRTCRR